MSFLYNVGPGSASVWLPIGSFAPRHVLMANDGFQPAPPFSLVGNENTQLDGRYSAVDADAAGERRDFDPSKTPLEGA